MRDAAQGRAGSADHHLAGHLVQRPRIGLLQDRPETTAPLAGHRGRAAEQPGRITHRNPVEDPASRGPRGHHPGERERQPAAGPGLIAAAVQVPHGHQPAGDRLAHLVVVRLAEQDSTQERGQHGGSADHAARAVTLPLAFHHRRIEDQRDQRMTVRGPGWRLPGHHHRARRAEPHHHVRAPRQPADIGVAGQLPGHILSGTLPGQALADLHPAPPQIPGTDHGHQPVAMPGRQMLPQRPGRERRARPHQQPGARLLSCHGCGPPVGLITEPQPGIVHNDQASTTAGRPRYRQVVGSAPHAERVFHPPATTAAWGPQRPRLIHARRVRAADIRARRPDHADLLAGCGRDPLDQLGQQRGTTHLPARPDLRQADRAASLRPACQIPVHGDIAVHHHTHRHPPPRTIRPIPRPTGPGPKVPTGRWPKARRADASLGLRSRGRYFEFAAGHSRRPDLLRITSRPPSTNSRDNDAITR